MQAAEDEVALLPVHQFFDRRQTDLDFRGCVLDHVSDLTAVDAAGLVDAVDGPLRGPIIPRRVYREDPGLIELMTDHDRLVGRPQDGRCTDGRDGRRDAPGEDELTPGQICSDDFAHVYCGISALLGHVYTPWNWFGSRSANPRNYTACNRIPRYLSRMVGSCFRICGRQWTRMLPFSMM